ncbi:hypothetical protein A9Q87_03785 [Flavobacteriales bacterium 34_180_T64]|nr:hypothetical protein A9Q87_03785 [Flavobacteriales bacterium 34_180_T64]
MTSFSQCSSSKHTKEKQALILQENVSFELGEVYCQRWSSGLKEGGSGIHVYISVVSNRNNVSFDSLYFRGLKGKIVTGKMGYFVDLKTKINQNKDIIMSGDSKHEYGNEFPEKKSNVPFILGANECVLRFTTGNTVHYYKISDVAERSPLNYPSAPPNKQ